MNGTAPLAGLRRANTVVGSAVGAMLALTVLFVIADITLRRFGRSLGGSDEISGYAMAITASWGLGYALLERAHVRIDLLHRRLPGAGRAVLDLASIAALALTAALVAFQCWPVLEKSLSGGSRANTPLETPLWIPQSLWFGGWLWFAGCALAMLVAAVGLLAGGRRDAFDEWFGAGDEGDAALQEASALHGSDGSDDVDATGAGREPHRNDGADGR